MDCPVARRRHVRFFLHLAGQMKCIYIHPNGPSPIQDLRSSFVQNICTGKTPTRDVRWDESKDQRRRGNAHAMCVLRRIVGMAGALAVGDVHSPASLPFSSCSPPSERSTETPPSLSFGLSPSCQPIQSALRHHASCLGQIVHRTEGWRERLATASIKCKSRRCAHIFRDDHALTSARHAVDVYCNSQL